MLEYLIKSSACLAVLLLFYKLFLEKENMHIFKRFYLLTCVLLSILIPFITFTQVVEVPLIINETVVSISATSSFILDETPNNYLLYALWSIYFIGVLFFTLKFIYNLTKISLKIKRNPKLKVQKSIQVLLKELIVPHTFLNYIFLNKAHFEAQQIPKEVLIHEEAHVIQKHSLDILFIELCQIVFWFQPLIFLLKRSIKLNHEFLADREVINQGINLPTYQQILLAFSSNALEPQLATAINYSSIKKRFTVMKTQTSKSGIWLRSIILLPILALLIFSFSTKKVIEKEIESNKEMQQKANIEIENIPVLEINKNPLQLKLNGKITTLESLETDFNSIVGNKKSSVKLKSNDVLTTEFIYNLQKHFGVNVMSLDVSIPGTKVIDENSFLTESGIQELLPTINGISCEGCIVNLSKEGAEKLILGTNSDEAVTSFLIKFIGKPTVSVKGNKLNKEAIALVKENDPFKMIQIFNIKTTNSYIRMPILIQLVDKSDSNYTESPIVKKGEKSDIPAPPTPPNTPEMKMAHDIPPPPPIPADATPAERTKYQKTIDEYYKNHSKKVKEGDESNIPPPPPKSPLDFVIEMAKKDATFYFGGKQITSDEAINMLKENKSLNISAKNSSSKNPKIYLSKEPITID